MPVLRALLYLRLTTLRNKAGSQLRRLRQPKYLAGALAAAVYLWFFIFRKTGRGSPGQVFDAMLAPGHLEVIAAIVITLFLVLIWVAPSDNPGLAFSEPEVAFLFPAPFSRRQLIHYKLLDGLLMSLLGAVFFLLITGGWHTGVPGALRRLVAWWSLNANLTLHQTAAALAVARLARFGLGAVLRRTVLLVAAGAAVAALVLIGNRFGAASLEPLLWPARLAVRPFFAGSVGGFLLALVPAFALVGLHYFWIFRMEAPFEEASIAGAQKRGELIARMRAGRAVRIGGKARARAGPFTLSDRLPVEAAFLWKNLMAAPGYLNRKVFAAALAIVCFGFTWLKARPHGGPDFAFGAAIVAIVSLVYVLVFGPQVARNDLRGDIVNADILKTYPLPGWRILLGSLLAPTLILTAISWLFLFAIGLGFVPPGNAPRWFTPQFRAAVVAGAAIAMPALCAVQLLVPTAATLIFPAWSQTSRNMGGGMDVMGQRLIFFAGQFIFLLFALLPALLAALAPALTFWIVGVPAAIVLTGLTMFVVLAVEVWFGVHFLGPRFEQLDISAELRP